MMVVGGLTLIPMFLLMQGMPPSAIIPVTMLLMVPAALLYGLSF